MTSYATGKRRYLSFCQQFSFPPLPVCEAVLCRFVAFLFSSSLSYQTIRSYLSAIRHLQIMSGLPDPSFSSFPRLDYVLKGSRRCNTATPRPKRLPITPAILHQILKVWSRDPPTYDRRMLWAAFCLGFFGFMRAGEFTCPQQGAGTQDILAWGDVAVDSHSSPTHLTIRLKRTKTDPFGAGTTLYLGITGDVLCPVAAVLGYLAVRPPSPGPLLCFQDGKPLSKPRLVQALRQALRAAGVDDSGYSGHSFRIGAATAAARAGLSDSFIQMLGRWKSSAFSLYIRTPWQRLAQVSSRLVAQPQIRQPESLVTPGTG